MGKVHLYVGRQGRYSLTLVRYGDSVQITIKNLESGHTEDRMLEGWIWAALVAELAEAAPPAVCPQCGAPVVCPCGVGIGT